MWLTDTQLTLISKWSTVTPFCCKTQVGLHERQTHGESEYKCWMAGWWGAAEILNIGENKQSDCKSKRWALVAFFFFPQKVGCDRWWWGVLKQATFTAWRHVQKAILLFLCLILLFLYFQLFMTWHWPSPFTLWYVLLFFLYFLTLISLTLTVYLLSSSSHLFSSFLVPSLITLSHIPKKAGFLGKWTRSWCECTFNWFVIFKKYPYKHSRVSRKPQMLK